MKRLALSLLLAAALVFAGSADARTPYCEGWSDGYAAGYCYQRYGCIEPITPICPIPRVQESRNSYQDGYNRGFIAGRKRRP